jgi:hypothetical protein
MPNLLGVRANDISVLRLSEVVAVASSPHRFAMTDQVQQLSRGARRARIYRSRRRRGVRVVPIALVPREFDALVHLGYLAPEVRGDRDAVQRALRGYVAERLRKDVPPVWDDEPE